MADPFPLEDAFFAALRRDDWPLPRHSWPLEAAGLDGPRLVELFESQLLSRHLDYQARRLQARGEAFYTIGSAGHEGNAAIAAAFRPTDPAFLHYRDAAFLIQRSKALPGQTLLHDLLQSFCAAADDPVSGGRHKVLGSVSLTVPPQTSTIASHLPKAVGAAHSLGLWRRLGGGGRWPADSVVLCSFGDASFNHSTAQGALNAAGWAAYQAVPMPLVLVCEDNAIGISTPTPKGWVAASMRARPGIHYLSCDGLDPLDTYRTAREAERLARRRRQPVFLHMHCVRLMGHAGSDAQQAYLSPARIKADEARDPLLVGAGLLRRHGLLSVAELEALYRAVGERVARVAETLVGCPRLAAAAEVMASIVPPARPSRRRASAAPVAADDAPAPMARLINQAMTRLMGEYPHLVMAGEDIGRKGGVYGVTQRLQARFGASRVIDTLLDEQSILGLGIGLAHNDLLPMVEIQYLAYLHNAEDQLRGEAATLSFFSRGQYTNPMVVRVAGLGYQKGFGGHFHNDNAIAVLRDIPGLLVACPSNGADAVGLLQEAVRLADEEQRVVVVLEPIARYHTRDLLEEGDQRWCFVDPGPEHCLPAGRPGCDGKGQALAIITYGNGVFLSHQARARLGVAGVRIIDLRWLTGLDHDAIHRQVADCAQVLCVDECRRTGSLSEEIITALVERGLATDRLHRLTAEDSFIALGPAATATLPSTAAIAERARQLLGDGTTSSSGAIRRR